MITTAAPESSVRSVGSDVGDRRLVSLDPGRLSAAGLIAWLWLLRFALDQAGVEAEVQVDRRSLYPALAGPAFMDALCGQGLRVRWADRDLTPAETDAFVMVSGSAVFSTRLLRRFARLHIAPAGPPEALEPRLYRAAIAESAFDVGLDALFAAAVDCVPPGARVGGREALHHAQRRVSLLSSVFAGDTYLSGFLANCAGLEDYGACEHLLVRAGSPGNEHEALRAHVERWPCAVYINLASDPGLYEVWNLCTRLATAPYLSNANVDDRRAPGHVARLTQRLDRDPAIDVASTALRMTRTRNLAWEASADCPVWYAEDGDRTYGAADLLKARPGGVQAHNMPHCMPVWRRELHAFHGGFREREFGPSADWEFWLRVASRGTRFGLVAEPLGLYLKDDESYWQCGSADGTFNDRILDRYGPLLDTGGSIAASSEGPLARLFDDIREHVRCAAWFELVAALVRGAREVSDAEPDATATELIRRLGRHYLGEVDLPAWAADDPRGLLGRADNPTGIGDVLLDVLHAHAPSDEIGGSVGSAALQACPGRVLWGALVDLHELTEDPRALLACSLLRRWQGRLDVARCLLEQVYREQGQAFWTLAQEVFRFRVPLDELVSDLGVARTCGQQDRQRLARVDLRFFPDYRRGNPYQSLLYAEIRDQGGEVRPLAELGELDTVVPAPERDNIVHIHWLQGLFEDVSRSGFLERGRWLLERIRRLQDQGVRVYWTIHNALNHDAVMPEAETAFRHVLARRVDRVYVHHPLVPGALDWFPADREPWLVEHGPYLVDHQQLPGRAEARARLGLAPEEFVLVSAGIVRDYKQLDAYIPVFRAWMEREPRFRLAVIGQVASRSVRDALAELPADQVTVRNEKVADDEYQAWLRAADFAFLSYRAILTSGSLFHALSLGVPVIAPDLGTIPAYVVHGWNGYVYHGESDLDATLQRAVEASQAARSALAANAASTARRLHWRFC